MAAKAKGGSKGSSGEKVVLGKKSKGKAKKKYGPREEKPKAYRGQGR